MTTTENRATKRHDAICPDSLHNSRKRTIHSFIPYTPIRWTLFPYPFVPSRSFYSASSPLTFPLIFSPWLYPCPRSIHWSTYFPVVTMNALSFVSRDRREYIRIFQFSSIEKIKDITWLKLITSKYCLNSLLSNRDIIFILKNKNSNENRVPVRSREEKSRTHPPSYINARESFMKFYTLF